MEDPKYTLLRMKLSNIFQRKKRVTICHYYHTNVRLDVSVTETFAKKMRRQPDRDEIYHILTNFLDAHYSVSGPVMFYPATGEFKLPLREYSRYQFKKC